MSTVLIAYTTDAWHSHASKELIGVFTSMRQTLKSVRETYPLSAEDQEMLMEQKQTQGLEQNILIEEYELNQVLQTT